MTRLSSAGAASSADLNHSAGTDLADATHQPLLEKGEVEWVDWLDEYQKMKETKLRTEKEEVLKKTIKEVEAATDEEEEVVRGPAHLTPPPNAHLRPASAMEPRLTKSRSQSQILGEGDGARRPSAAPSPSTASSKNSPGNSRSTSLAAPSGQSSEQWTSRSRSVSSSPVVPKVFRDERHTSSGANTKRRRNLGGKIEAWWSAVKSGFSVQVPEEIARPGIPLPRHRETRPAKEVPGSTGLGQRARQHSNLPLEPEISGRTLKSQTSATTLRTIAPSMSQSQPPSAGLSHPPPTPSAAMKTSTAEDARKALPLEANRKRQPPLSLDLDKAMSTFNSPRFGKARPEFGRERSDSPPDSPRGTRKLSQPWGRSKPSSGSSSGDRSPFEATLAGHRDSGLKSSGRSIQSPPTMSYSKDITINYMRQQIRQRLALSKQNCDNELRKIVASINSFVEEILQEGRGGYESDDARSEVSGLQLREDERAQVEDGGAFDPDETAHGE